MKKTVTLFCFLLAGCFGPKTLVGNGFVKLTGIYSIQKLPNTWKSTFKRRFNNDETGHILTFHDGYFVRCPGPQLIMLKRAEIFPGTETTNSSAKDSADAFEKKVQFFSNNFYVSKNLPASRVTQISFKKSDLVPETAFEFVMETREKTAACPGEQSKEKLVRYKVIAIKSSSKKQFTDWGDATDMVQFWYSCPVDQFDLGERDFDEMVRSYRPE